MDNTLFFLVFLLILSQTSLIICKEHGVKLLYYDSEHKHTEFLGEKVYNDVNNLLKEITSYG